jgi:hypothetical protein
MPVWAWILIAIAVVLVVAAVAALAEAKRRRERTDHLREQFGPEYGRVVGDADNRREAESELEAREERRKKLDIRPLAQESRDRYGDEWHTVQERFVDDPGGAVDDADRLVQNVMAECGYPTDDFEQRSADISVDHPEIVSNYRRAHAIHVAHGKGEATTEELRNAFVGYRALFDELLGAPVTAVR